MKTFLLLLVSVAALSLNAQVYTNYFEGAVAGEFLIDYMNADDVNDIDDLWAKSEKAGYDGGTDGTSPVFSSEDNLRYSGYIGSEKGISVEIDSSNREEDGTRLYTRGFQINGDDTLKFNGGSGNDTSIYVAFLIKPLADAVGGMRDIVSFEKSSTGNWSRGRAFMDIVDGTSVQFGVGKKDSPTNEGDTATRFANGLGDTYLVVLKYEQHPGGPDPGNDRVLLYVNPDLSKSESEQMYIKADSTEKDYDSDGVLKINICQRGHTAEIGCIRVGTDWDEVLLGSAVTGVTLDQETAEIAVDGEVELLATVAPEGEAADPSVTWTSSDEAVATVDDGLVTGVAEGTADIIVTTVDGSFTDTCVVTVTGDGGGTGLNDIDVMDNLVYPNPSSGNFTIANSEGADLSIYNVVGKLVYQQSDLESNASITSNLSKGIYFIKLVNDTNETISRIIIE